MQVHGPGVDIDTLCIGPSYVNREVKHFCLLLLLNSVNSLALVSYFSQYNSLLQEDFFFGLHDILAEMEEITELQPINDAHVPVMKFKFQGISIDLLYASISLLVVPEVSLAISSAFICSESPFLGKTILLKIQNAIVLGEDFKGFPNISTISFMKLSSLGLSKLNVTISLRHILNCYLSVTYLHFLFVACLV